jgi:hypothetical protein
MCYMFLILYKYRERRVSFVVCRQSVAVESSSMYRQIEIGLAMGETPTRRRVQFPKDFSVKFWVVLTCGVWTRPRTFHNFASKESNESKRVRDDCDSRYS